MNNWFVGYTGLELRHLCMKPLNNTMTNTNTNTMHRSASELISRIAARLRRLDGTNKH